MFSAVAEQVGLDYQAAVKISAGFGGGMMLGSVCGAVAGGIMAIGLKRGGVGTQSGMVTGRIVREFTDRFKAQHKAVNCAELTGFDIGKVDVTKPEAVAEAYKSALAKNQFAACTGYVRDATKIVTELLNAPLKA
ncbi:MAG: C-GCAxxG-C-C family protein [Bacteroidales bacterium]